MMTDSEIPKAMKLTMIFIDRVGFPTMAFLLMAYMCFVTLAKVTGALNENTKVLTIVSTEFRNHDDYTRRALRSIGAEE